MRPNALTSLGLHASYLVFWYVVSSLPSPNTRHRHLSRGPETGHVQYLLVHALVKLKMAWTIISMNFAKYQSVAYTNNVV